MVRTKSKLIPLLSLALFVHSAHAGFSVYHDDFDGWSAAAGSYTTLDFVFEESTIMNDQYLDLGVLFPDMEELAFPGDPSLYQQDGWGLKGAAFVDEDIHMMFLQPQYTLGVWFPGMCEARLYYQGELVYDIGEFPLGAASYGFGGVISTQPFDEVLLTAHGSIFVDDILFGVPAPGTLAILGLGVIGRSRRRSC